MRWIVVFMFVAGAEAFAGGCGALPCWLRQAVKTSNVANAVTVNALFMMRMFNEAAPLASGRMKVGSENVSCLVG
jgi:hypothetical protein